MRRHNVREILSNPALRIQLVLGATDFICKLEGIRPDSPFPPMQFTNFTATGRNLYILYRNGRNEQAWDRLGDIPADLVPLASESRRIAVTSDQYDALYGELVK